MTEILIKAFGENYIGEFDRKHYIWANDGNEKVQIAIALTCPKVYRGIEETNPTVLNFDDDDESSTGTKFKPAEISSEEEDTLKNLMEKLGL